ncbi:2-hydroxyacyl-CoA dehydratase [Candidatus Bathyarchaeota archaeon]|nr:2-hydroxyacyl-CoA dehydratase [Candidatus Bathyarchaeota archaeon]
MIETLMEMVKERPESIKQSKRDGLKVVGYLCPYIPEELITAAGMIPIRMVSGSSYEAMHAGEQYVKPYSCPYVRSCIGNKANGEPYYDLLDALCVACTCDGMKNLQQYWRRYFDIPVYTVGVPQTSNRFRTRQQAIEYFRGELRQLRRSLEELNGREISDRRLRSSIRFHNLIRARMRRLYEYTTSEPPLISWREVFKISHAGFLLDRVQFLEEATRIVEALKSSRRTKAENGSKPRLVIYGSLMSFEDTKVLDLAENAGGKIVGDALCTGSRFWRKDVALDVPSIDGLVERYLHNIPCAYMTDTTMRLNYVVARARESRAQGLIYYTLKSCDTFRSEFRIFEEALRKELGIPALLIETEYSPADMGTTRTKIEAFLEMLRGI